MTREDRLCRWAGALYLVVVVTGMFSLMWVPSRLAGSGDLSARLAAITSHEPLFRAGIAGFLVEQVAFLLLPLVLFQLLREVHHAAATAMVVLALVSVPIALVSLLHKVAILALIGGAPDLAQIADHLRAYDGGLLITSLFWGLWLLPFGYLVTRSGFLPRALGILLLLGGAGYLVEVFGTILAPGYPKTALADVALLPAAAGEIGICLWLLIMGARPRRGSRPDGSASGPITPDRGRMP